MPMLARKRIEIIVDAPLVPRIVDACSDAGIGGHTVLPLLSGRGGHEAWNEDRLSGAASKVMVLVIASAERAERLVEALTPVLDSHRLVLTIGDVTVVRSDRFS